MASALYLISNILFLAVFVLGVLVALLGRHRDPRMALLAALGFGCQLISALLLVAEGVLTPMLVRSVDFNGVALVDTAVSLLATICQIAGVVLILLAAQRGLRMGTFPRSNARQPGQVRP